MIFVLIILLAILAPLLILCCAGIGSPPMMTKELRGTFSSSDDIVMVNSVLTTKGRTHESNN
jgi:hypothetical protein